MSTTNFSDWLPMPTGRLSILVEDVITGKSWFHLNEQQTIVLIAKRNVVRLLGGDNLPLRYISKMRYTAQGNDPLDITKAIPTFETWESMGRPDLIPVPPIVYVTFGVNNYKSINTTTYSDNLVTNTSTVTFTTVVEANEGNGGAGSQIYSQAGLFTVDESLQDGGVPNSGLFAIKDFPVLVKTNNLRFTFNWAINI